MAINRKSTKQKIAIKDAMSLKKIDDFYFDINQFTGIPSTIRFTQHDIKNVYEYRDTYNPITNDYQNLPTDKVKYKMIRAYDNDLFDVIKTLQKQHNTKEANLLYDSRTPIEIFIEAKDMKAFDAILKELQEKDDDLYYAIIKNPELRVYPRWVLKDNGKFARSVQLTMTNIEDALVEIHEPYEHQYFK